MVKVEAQLDAGIILTVWTAEYKVVARAALAEQPQQLEALGFGAVP